MSAAPDKSSGKHPSPAKPHTQLPMQVSVALLLGAAALLLAAVNWYSARREDETRDAQLATLTQNFTGLEQAAAQKSALDAESAAVQQSLKAETDRLDSLDSALTEMRKHSEEGRDAWIKAEAASLLVAANEEIEIRADPALALKALQQADARLKLLPDPRLIAVRQEIAREINALRAVPQADIEGMAVVLTSLAESVGRLPLRTQRAGALRTGWSHRSRTRAAEPKFLAAVPRRDHAPLGRYVHSAAPQPAPGAPAHAPGRTDAAPQPGTETGHRPRCLAGP